VQPPTGASHSPSVSRDGERVAVVSMARLAPEDTSDFADVYLRDVRSGLTLLSQNRRREVTFVHRPPSTSIPL
jgi:hypothetical protein